MPGLHSANIASRLIDSVGAGKTIGPLLTGLKHSAQIVKVGASVSEIVTLALFAAANKAKVTISETLAPTLTICAECFNPVKRGPIVLPAPTESINLEAIFAECKPGIINILAGLDNLQKG